MGKHFTRNFVPSDFLSERQLKKAVDKLHCVFIKQILAVNSTALNWAVLSETNRSSLIPGIMTRMISFWKHLQDSPSPITHETVKLSKALHDENHYSWFTGLSKTVEVLGDTNDFLASTVQRKSALRRILENQWYSSRVKFSQGKLRLCTTLKERPGFETYLALNNTKLRQGITKLRITHKLPIETGRCDQKTQMQRICPLCCEGIGNETHYISECKNNEMIKVSNEYTETFYKNWKGLEKLSTENFCRAILSGQTDDLLYEVGLLCLRIQKTFELEAL